MQNPSLLIATTPHQVLPELAAAIGLNEALFLQQLHWLLTNNDCKTYQGKHWYWHSEDQWLDRFPYFSKSTLKRTITSLSKQKLIDQEKLHWQLLGIRGDTTKWYSIDYDKVSEISIAAFTESEKKKQERWKAKREAKEKAKEQAIVREKYKANTHVAPVMHGKGQNELSRNGQNDLSTRGQNDLPYKTNKKQKSSSKPEPAQIDSKPDSVDKPSFDFDLVLAWLVTQFERLGNHFSDSDRIFIEAALQDYIDQAQKPNRSTAYSWIEQALVNRFRVMQRSHQNSDARDRRTKAVVAAMDTNTSTIEQQAASQKPRTLADKLSDTSWADDELFDNMDNEALQ